MSQALVLPTLTYKLRFRSGPEKGHSYKINSSMISIGRSSENDIVVKGDVKCSRKHVEIHFLGTHIEARDVSSNNSMSVDGNTCKQAVVNHGSIIVLGETELEFIIENQDANLAIAQPGQMGAAANQQVNMVYSQSSAPSKKASPLLNKKRLIIYGGIILLLVWLFTGKKKVEEKEIDIRMEKEIELDIEAQKKLIEDQSKQREKKGFNKKYYKQAQVHYIKGFRDFQKGQFARAQVSFQACLSIFPSHVLCQRYIQKSRKKADEMTTYQMAQGRRYLDQGQFQACKSSFLNVMNSVNDQRSKVFKEALANYRYCDLQTEGRY